MNNTPFGVLTLIKGMEYTFLSFPDFSLLANSAIWPEYPATE